ncbi:MAG: S-layer homology domain-containing protein [Clostridia bacterium]|nr:S-layer homology domain-containing protein [Clostridia bacterium]
MKRLISLLIALVMLSAAIAAAIPVSAAKTDFPDVEDGRWSEASIAYAVKEGYMNGVGGGLFDPEGSLTRAMVATVLWRREGSPAPTAPSGFEDVRDGEWYTDAVAWAKEAGVVKGLTMTTFGPDEFITREQLSTMLFRFSSTAPVSVPERADLSPFADDEKVSDWADEPLKWAVEAGLIKGTDGNMLAPDGFATREQFAAIIERYEGTFTLKYNTPVIRSHHTEKPYPLVNGADIYVATDGDDANPGTFDSPLASFAGAVAKVREIKETKTSGDIVVAFKAGNYGAIEAELGVEDGGSPDQQIIYCKYGDGEVKFDNGITIKKDDFSPLSESERQLFNDRFADGIKKIDVGSLIDDVPDFYDFALFSDNSLCTPARYPNKYPDGSDQFIQAAETWDEDPDLFTLNIFNGLVARRLEKYTDEMISDMVLYGYLVRGFRKDTFEAVSYDKETGLMRVENSSSNEFGGRLRSGWRDADGEGIRMILENVSFELDYAGEYWLDRDTGILYVFEPDADYHIPLPHGEYKIRGIKHFVDDNVDELPSYCAIYAENTGYITFRGFSFTNNVDEFILGYRTSGIKIDRCSFDCCTGDNQLLFEYSLDGEPLGLEVTDSEFDLCVGRHVYVADMADTDYKFTDRTDAVIDNCRFANSNLMFDAEGAVNLYRCSGGTVSHCVFENCCRYGVMFTGSLDVTVEYNDFESVMTNSDDGGVTRGYNCADGYAVVRYNYYGPVSAGSVGRFAHYCDEGDCGTVMYGNIFYQGGDFMLNGPCRDNDVSDNVFINPWTTVNGVRMGHSTSGIIENGETSEDYDLGRWRQMLRRCAEVEGFAEALEARRPGASTISLDFADVARKNFVLAPTNTFNDNLFINENKVIGIYIGGNGADYATAEGNAAYGLDENPVFVNPTLGDYRIRDGVDFPDIHFEEIGRY